MTFSVFVQNYTPQKLRKKKGKPFLPGFAPGKVASGARHNSPLQIKTNRISIARCHSVKKCPLSFCKPLAKLHNQQKFDVSKSQTTLLQSRVTRARENLHRMRLYCILYHRHFKFVSEETINIFQSLGLNTTQLFTSVPVDSSALATSSR